MIERHTQQELPAGLPSTAGADGASDFSQEHTDLQDAAKLNLEALLTRCGGDHQLVETLAEMFPPESLKLLDNLEQARTHQDVRGVQLNAHTLKGMCSMFDASKAADAALELEMAAASADLGTDKQYESLKVELGRAIAMVSNMPIERHI